MDHKQLTPVIKVIVGIMLLMALGSWKYSYYQILRVVVCGASVYLAWRMFDLKLQGWAWGFIALAILFNPLYPIYLDKSVWQLIDVFAAVFFFASLSTEKKKE